MNCESRATSKVALAVNYRRVRPPSRARSPLHAAGLLLALSAEACGSCQSGDELESAPEFTPSRSYDGAEDCFSASAPSSQSAQRVFAEEGRAGGGATWLAILLHVLDKEARRGEEEIHEEMGFGTQEAVLYQGKRSWIGHDSEGDAAVFCTPYPALLNLLRSTYERAQREPDRLRALIRATHFPLWDE
jgi:hypothetical protein